MCGANFRGQQMTKAYIAIGIITFYALIIWAWKCFMNVGQPREDDK